MSLGSFLKSLVNPEAMGDEIIAVQERVYREAQRMHPGADPHMYLAQAWLVRMAAHGKNPTDEMLKVMAFSETMQFACVAPPNNMRALGLYFIYKERPDIIQNYPKFGLEFARLMAPVMAATENGSMEALYQRFNPQLAAQAKAAEESNGSPNLQTGTQGSHINAKAQERANTPADLKKRAAGATPMQESTPQQNHYEVLGLPWDAGRDLIEQQCIRLGERYRPDKNSGDLRAALMFAQIEKAYETLVNPVRRAAYDAELLRQPHFAKRSAAGGSTRPQSMGIIVHCRSCGTEREVSSSAQGFTCTGCKAFNTV